MDLRRLRIGDLIVGVAGVFLIVSLFLPWYGSKGEFESGIGFAIPDDLRNGWESLGGPDFVLLMAGLLGIALVVLTATQRTVAIPIALAAIVTLVAVLALVIVVYRLLVLPDPSDAASQPELTAETVRKPGLWLAAGATLLEVVGGLRAMRDERLSRPGHPTDITGRPVAAQPRVQTLAAPSASSGDPAAGRERE